MNFPMTAMQAEPTQKEAVGPIPKAMALAYSKKKGKGKVPPKPPMKGQR